MDYVKFKYGTSTQYNGLSTKDEGTLYFLTDLGVFYKGSTPFSGITKAAVSTSGSDIDESTTLTLTPSVGSPVTFTVASKAAVEAIFNALEIHVGTTANASTSGHVKLSDSTSSTSSVTGGVAATPKAVKDALDSAKEYSDSLFTANDVMVFQGTLGTGGTVTALPTTGYKVGWTYRVITAGTYAGQVCEVGDMIICVKSYATSFSNSDWSVQQANIDGAVTANATLTSNTLILGGGSHVVKPLANGDTNEVLIVGASGPKWGAVPTHNHSASNITSGTLSVARGGTGKTTFTAGQVLVGAGTSPLTQLAIDTSVAESSSNLVTSGAVFSAIQEVSGVAANLVWQTIV